MTPDLIVFGGTFDPPHMGHRHCLELVGATFPKAEIIVIPGKNPPSADGRVKAPVEDHGTRLHMCELAFADMPGVQISAIEGELPVPNYTVATLQRLSEIHPDRRLGLVMGQDQFRSFPKWKDPKQILELADLIAIERDERKPLAAIAKKVFAELDVKTEVSELSIALPELGRSAFLLSGDPVEASSSEIRLCFLKGQELPLGWVPDKVLSFIREAHYYRKGTV